MQIQRIFLPNGASPSSFAVGLPGGVNFCFDPVRGAVSYVWIGGFLDLTPARPGIGDGGREYWPSWEEAAKTDLLAARILDRYRHHPPEELYDVQLDPFEQINLASDSRYTGILANLRARLAAWREEQGDRIASP